MLLMYMLYAQGSLANIKSSACKMVAAMMFAAANACVIQSKGCHWCPSNAGLQSTLPGGGGGGG